MVSNNIPNAVSIASFKAAENVKGRDENSLILNDSYVTIQKTKYKLAVKCSVKIVILLNVVKYSK